MPVVGSIVPSSSRSAQDTPVGDVGRARTLLQFLLQFVEVLDGSGVDCPRPETLAFYLEGSKGAAL
jgi:hypothetical protein